MVDRQGEDMLGIDGTAVAVPAQHGDGVGDHGDLEGMLRVVFRLGIPHQGPAADELQPGKVSKKG